MHENTYCSKTSDRNFDKRLMIEIKILLNVGSVKNGIKRKISKQKSFSYH